MVRSQPRAPRLCQIAVIVSASICGVARAQVSADMCGNPFVNHFGPFDYRTAPRDALNNVETNHFQPYVEALVRGVTSERHLIAMDIAYTLRVFPNHHRALLAMSRLVDREKMDPPRGTGTVLDCWFDRAIRFRPDDTVARLLYVQVLIKRKRIGEARTHLEAVEELANDNPLTHFNLGLAYFDIGDFERALASAHRSRALGYSRSELADKLRSAGRWREPTS